MVVTGDRDLFQLVEPGVRVMATSRGITETKVYDREAVIDRYGIAPELIPDFVGLKGDTSDNIPGVPGIGEKTASQLLQEHGSLEGVLGSIDKISGAKRKENLTNHAGDARVSKQLATAIRDVDIGTSTWTTSPRANPTARACARPSASSSCGAARAARGGARGGGGRRAGRARRGGRSTRSRARCRSPRSGARRRAGRLAAERPRPAGRAGRPGDPRRRRPAARADEAGSLRGRERCSWPRPRPSPL